MVAFIQFVEPDDTGNYISADIIPSEDDMTTVRKLIRETWLNIQNHDFYTDCGKEDCHWCTFVKDKKQYIALKDLLAEEQEEIV